MFSNKISKMFRCGIILNNCKKDDIVLIDVLLDNIR